MPGTAHAARPKVLRIPILVRVFYPVSFFAKRRASAGILGEYVGRIYLGVSEKPQSVVRERVTSSRTDSLQP